VSASAPLLTDTTAFVLCAVAALSASYVLVTRIARVADRAGLSEITLGLLVALAADSPEIASAITASAHGAPMIGAGVVLGSNVFNLAALLGLASIVSGVLVLHRRVVLLDGACAVWVAIVAVRTVTTGIGAAAGTALVLVAVVPYVVITARTPRPVAATGRARRLSEWLRGAVRGERTDLTIAVPDRAGRSIDGWLIATSLAVVVATSTVMERSAQTLGHHFGVSALVVGGVVLAAITSVPNAVGAVYLARHSRAAAVLSEALNSNMINVLAGLLLPGLVVGLARPSTGGDLVAVWYAALTVACVMVAGVRGGLSRRQGWAIIAAYVAFVVVAVAL
jgi:cation:H+ antiporter